MKFFAAFLAIAGVSSTLSVEVVGSLRGNYDSVAAAVAVSDTKEVSLPLKRRRERLTKPYKSFGIGLNAKDVRSAVTGRK
mmetsp:Transcript_7151/g.10509  ORF Transcript_7151/g.10509 Transcript_7151/m.10509 type:complete len:80 (+) Transcript_7151:56-295(+)